VNIDGRDDIEAIEKYQVNIKINKYGIIWVWATLYNEEDRFRITSICDGPFQIMELFLAEELAEYIAFDKDDQLIIKFSASAPINEKHQLTIDKINF